jgi:hypothetical protein
MTTLLGRILTSRKLPSKGQLLQATANRAKSFIKNPINTLKDGLNAHKTANNIATNQSTIIGRTLTNRQLPGKREILQSASNGIKSFVKNPIQAVKSGLARDKLAVQKWGYHTGQTRGQTAINLGKSIASGVYKGGGKDMLVNTGGLIGSIKGAAIGGKIGSLAGDWAGAATARKGLDDLEATRNAFKIRNNPNFQKQPLNVKARILSKRASGYAKANKKGFNSELKQDTIGWGIGNSSADVLATTAPSIPFKGAAVAMGTTKPVYKGFRVAKKIATTNTPKIGRVKALGTGITKGVTSTGRTLRRNLNPARAVKTGLNREKTMYNSVNNSLSKLPRVPAGVSFSSSYLLCDFNVSTTKYRR